MKKIGLIALALVLSLGLMGAGLAYWNETLTINGSVATGELDIEFLPDDDGSYCEDGDGDMPYGAECAVAYEDDGDVEPGASPVDMSKAMITITNGYPSYTCSVWLVVHNNGTIPARIEVQVVSADPELDVSISNPPAGTVIGPCEIVVFDVTIHVGEGDNEAEELSTYSCEVQVRGKQFNDSALW